MQRYKGKKRNINITSLSLVIVHGALNVQQVVFQLYSSNTDEGWKGEKAHGWVAKICQRNSWPSKLELSVVEMCEKIFLLSEVKIKFSIEPNMFIVCIYYATKLYKKVWEEFSTKYSEVLLILTIILCGRVKIRTSATSQLCILKKYGCCAACPRKELCDQFFHINNY